MIYKINKINLLPRQAQILVYLANLLKERKSIKKIDLDIIFFELVNKNNEIDIAFQNLINPYSENLHSAIFDLEQDKMIKTEPFLKILKKGRTFLKKLISRNYISKNKRG